LIRSERAGDRTVPHTTTVIIGVGQCGLAMSRCLATRSIDHVVLERGEVANSWRTQRWDSLRLLTPNWMTRLPGYAYRGTDPDGYLSARLRATPLADALPDWEVLVSAFGEDGLVVEPDELVDPDRPER